MDTVVNQDKVVVLWIEIWIPPVHARRDERGLIGYTHRVNEVVLRAFSLPYALDLD
jgi:hypothetical protein